MKSIKLQYPWEGCIGYVVFHKNQGRYMMNIIEPDGNRTTTSYARYLMSVNLGRKLLSSEHVDHIDENKMNDVIENLQILSQRQNNTKHVNLSGKSSKKVVLTCPVCYKEFEKEPRLVNFKIKNGKTITCGRRCGGIYSHRHKN